MALGLLSYGCTGSETVHGPGNGNQAGAGGASATTGAGGSPTNPTTGAGGSPTNPTTGAGGSPTNPTTGAGGTPGTTGAGGTPGTTGAGGTPGTTGAGGTPGTTGAGGTPGTTGAGGTPGSSTDPNCTSTNAKTGATCTVDCIIPCGYVGLGTKTCTCAAGVYSACPCPKPASYQGAATAGYCTTADGTTTALKNTVCTTEWQECIGKDLVSGTTPQGCACLRNATTNALQWYCGSTNKWFALTP